MFKRLLFTVAMLAGACTAQAQDVSARFQGQVIGSRGLPLANQNVAVCTQPAVTTTQPCSPLATLATSTTTSSGDANPLTTDSNGNFFFYAAPGKYTVQVYGPAVSGQFVQPDTLVGASGPASLTTLTVIGTTTLGNTSFTSHNAMPWAGSPSPGATPTIDQSISTCTTLGVSAACMPSISPGYNGAESTNLFTTSTGYKVYTGSAIIADYRNNTVAFAPMYGITYGGRTGGALNRMGIVNFCQSPSDSCAGSNSWNQFAGTWPSNGGGQFGTVNLLMLHDSQIVGSSTTGLAATDSEVHMDATSADNPAFTAQAYTGGVQFSRASAVQDVLTAATFQSRGCGDNGVNPTARFYYCYGFDGSNTTNAITPYRNYAFHFNGPSMIENSQQFWASSADATVGVTATESGQTATFTMASNCAANPTFVAGALVGVTGMSIAGYNAQVIVSKAGCSGSSWSAFIPGTNNLAAGSGGTAQTTTPTVVTSYGVAGNNEIRFQPLADASGWTWKTKAGAAVWSLNASSLNFSSNANLNSGNPGASGPGLGASGGAWAFLGLGGSSGSYLFNPLAAAGARTINIPDFGANGPATQNYPLLSILTSQYTNSTTGFTNVAGGNTLQFTVAANTTYTAECHLYYQAAATGGLNIEFTGPASPTTVIYGLNDPSAATTFNSSVATAYSTSLGQVVGTAATNFDAIVSFSLINGANAGTVNLLAKSSAAVQLQIQAGSFCRVQ